MKIADLASILEDDCGVIRSGAEEIGRPHHGKVVDGHLGQLLVLGPTNGLQKVNDVGEMTDKGATVAVTRGSCMSCTRMVNIRMNGNRLDAFKKKKTADIRSE